MQTTLDPNALVVEDLGTLDACRALWPALRALNDASARPSPYLTPEYMQAYLAHNELHRPADVRARVLVCRGRDGAIVAALPLKEVRARALGLPFARLEFLVASEIDRPRLLAAPDDEEPAARALLRHLTSRMHRHALIELINQEPDSGLWRARDAARRPWTLVKDFDGMPINELRRTHADLGAYFKDLERSMRSSIARRSRRLCEAGVVRVLYSKDSRTLPDLLQVYLDVEARSWKAATRAGIARHPERRALYEALAASAQPMTLHLWLLLLDEAPMAALLDGTFGPNAFGLQFCYDEYLREVSPSNLLNLLSTDAFLRSDARTLQLHGHHAYYKQRWLADTEPTRNLLVYRLASPPALRTRLGQLRRRLRREVDSRWPSAADHNPVRRQVEGAPDENDAPSLGNGQPPRRVASAQALAALARARAVPGAVLELDVAALRQRLPFQL